MDGELIREVVVEQAGELRRLHSELSLLAAETADLFDGFDRRYLQGAVTAAKRAAEELESLDESLRDATDGGVGYYGGVAGHIAPVPESVAGPVGDGPK
jgi:hypothetical protein